MTDAVREAQVARDGFTKWLLREVPPGTVISDPAWWSDRVWRFASTLSVATRDAAWREAVARVRMLHSASCLRWIRNDDSQPCSCDDTTKIHNAALDALLDAMEGK